MRWIRLMVLAAFAVGLSACANTPTDSIDQIAVPTTTAVLAPRTTISTTAVAPMPTISTSPVVEASPYSLTPIFNFLGERIFMFEAVGYDAEAEKYLVYTKTGEGGPAIELRDTLPPLRPELELVDDGGGRTPGERHMILRDWFESFDVFWTEDKQLTLRSLRTGRDPLLGRTTKRLLGEPNGRLLFVDAEGPTSTDTASLVRLHQVDDNGDYVEKWAVEFEAEVLFALQASDVGVIVATAPLDRSSTETIDRIHLVEASGFTRSIKAPPGLITLQQPNVSGVDWSQTFAPCADEQTELQSNGMHGVDTWHIDATYQLVTACADGVPISTTTWCCGMGEYLGIMDSNRDGIEEVFVGGTSVGAAGAGVYSLVDGQLAPIRTENGEELSIVDGDLGDAYYRHGCRDENFVQVEVRLEGDKAWADRTTYRIDGHQAPVSTTSRIEWAVPEGTPAWRAHDMAPPEIVGDLLPCGAPDYFDLPGADGFRIHIRPHALSNAATCEVQWPRPYDPLMLTNPDGTEREWVSPNGDEISLHWIFPGDFLATEDGRFALLDYFPCSHEGTIKSIYTGRYDPSTGQLLEWRYIEPPDDYVSERLGYQRHPDRLVLDAEGRIVGELDTGVEVLRLELG